MSDASIDAIIARSRAGGAFGERKTFTIARERAIQKMRTFALKREDYFVLELAQSAVANGARYINVDAERGQFVFSYHGGYFRREALAQLFDFLFADKGDVSLGDVRHLALGVNALIGYKPERIIIESGDGTVEGSTRLEVSGGSDVVHVGTPDIAIDGTFVRADGLKRFRPMDIRLVLEDRGSNMPVPIIVNGDALFGYSSQRVPQSFGLSRYLEINEPDIRGTIGYRERGPQSGVRLLTYGVRVQTVELTVLDRDISGTLNFNRLRKTVDHSAFVQDEIFDELVARLQPYVARLIGRAQNHPARSVRGRQGEAIAPESLRTLLRSKGSVVLVDDSGDDLEQDAVRLEMADRIAAAIEAVVIRCDYDAFDMVRSVAGPDIDVVDVVPSAEAVAFYEQPMTQTPVDLACPPVTETLPADTWAAICERADSLSKADSWKQFAGGPAEITLFVTNDETNERGGVLEFTSSHRRLWRRDIRTAIPGLVIHVEVPRVRNTVEATRTALAWASFADSIVQHLASAIAALSDAALLNLDPSNLQMGGNAARRILSALPQHAFMRLVQQESTVAVRPTVSRPMQRIDFLNIPLLSSHSGTPLSITQLTDWLNEDGFIFGAPRGTWVDSPERTIVASGDIETSLIAVFGETAYARHDSRARLLGTEFTVPAAHSATTLGASPASRDALRWLQQRAVHDSSGALSDQPLFLLVDGQVATWAQLRDAGELIVHYNNAYTPAATVDVISGSRFQTSEPETLHVVADPWLVRVLRGQVRLRSAFDLVFDDGEPSTAPELLAPVEVSGETFQGKVGVPVDASHPRQLLIVDGRTRHVLSDIAERYGVVGVIRLLVPGFQHVEASVLAAVAQSAERSLQMLMVSFGKSPAGVASIGVSDADALRERTLIAYALAATHVRSEDGFGSVSSATPLAEQILNFPLFSVTTASAPVSARTVWGVCGAHSESAIADMLLTTSPALHFEFMATMAQRALVARTTSADRADKSAAQDHSDDPLLLQLERLIDHCRGDELYRADTPPSLRLMWDSYIESAFEYDELRYVVLLGSNNKLIESAIAQIRGKSRESPSSARSDVALLALGIYARVNYHLDPVTNADESNFAAKIADLLLENTAPDWTQMLPVKAEAREEAIVVE